MNDTLRKALAWTIIATPYIGMVGFIVYTTTWFGIAVFVGGFAVVTAFMWAVGAVAGER